jgi:8-oxo-dGTP diphosphatase
VKRVRVAAAVVFDGPRLLMTQRPPGGPLGLQWEFPGGKIESGETPEQAVVREVREELSVAATPHELLETVTHDYVHGLRVEIVFVRCTLDSFRFTLGAEVHAVRWQPPAETSLDDVLEADRAFLRSLGVPGRGPGGTRPKDGSGGAATLEGDSGP